jgi:hypothetical protein
VKKLVSDESIEMSSLDSPRNQEDATLANSTNLSSADVSSYMRIGFPPLAGNTYVSRKRRDAPFEGSDHSLFLAWSRPYPERLSKHRPKWIARPATQQNQQTFPNQSGEEKGPHPCLGAHASLLDYRRGVIRLMIGENAVIAIVVQC